MELLLKNGANVHAKDRGGLVPLHNACSYGHFVVAEMLLRAGANVNAVDLWNFTPLHEAAQKGREDICELLLAYGADPTVANCNGKAPTDVAISLELRDQLISKHRAYLFLSASKNCDTSLMKKLYCPEVVLFQHYLTKNTALHCVAQSNSSKRKSAAEYLVKKGANLNSKNKELCTPLHIAADNNATPVIECLVKHNVKVNALDHLGQTALHRAAKSGNYQVWRCLLANGADPTIVSLQGKNSVQMAPEKLQSLLEEESLTCSIEINRQLLEASKIGDVELLQRICHPRNKDCRDIEGRHSTPLHFAAGYNRIDAVRFLLSIGADVHAKDRGGLVPLHNACSYGHYEVCEHLLQYGADPNACDLWKFTPLHESAAKGKYAICKLLLSHGADPQRKNRDGNAPIDFAKERDPDIHDLLLGDKAIIEAAKKGELSRIAKLITAQNINCRDTEGRNSTPLHLAAGYNNLDVCAFLLENQAEVNAKDKGGLIPLHNSASYGHTEIATLLLQFGADINAQDRWGFTALHEAAYKNRTAICALLLSHGADPNIKDHEGRNCLEIAQGDDVKALIAAAMPVKSPLKGSVSSSLISSAVSSPVKLSSQSNNGSTTSIVKSKTKMSVQRLISQAVGSASKVVNIVSAADYCGSTSNAGIFCNDRSAGSGHMGPLKDSLDISCDEENPFEPYNPHNLTVRDFLKVTNCECLMSVFEREEISLGILLEMDHEDLKAAGVVAYGHRHKLVKGIRKFLEYKQDYGSSVIASMSASDEASILEDLSIVDPDFIIVSNAMQSTIREHKDTNGGVFQSYNIKNIQKIHSKRLWRRYTHRRREISDECSNQLNERLLFHGSPFLPAIVQKGFDERHAYIGGMFGAGIYFAQESSKSNQYVYGIGGGTGCGDHKDKSCYICTRTLLLCRVTLGKSFVQSNPMKIAHAPPGHHSVTGSPSSGGLSFTEYVIYRGEQAYPEFLVSYQIVAVAAIPKVKQQLTNEPHDESSSAEG